MKLDKTKSYVLLRKEQKMFKGKYIPRELQKGKARKKHCIPKSKYRLKFRRVEDKVIEPKETEPGDNSFGKGEDNTEKQ